MIRKVRLAPVIFFVFLVIIILIDLPENRTLKFSLGGFKVDTIIHPLRIDFQIGTWRIKKNFSTHLGLDLKGGSHLVSLADMKKIVLSDREDALSSLRDVVEKRVNFFGVSEPSIQTYKTGDNYRLTVDLPGVQDVSETMALIGKTAELDFREEAAMSSADIKEATQTPVILRLTQKTDLTGRHIKKSSIQFDPNTGKPVVALIFNGEGAKLFEEITKRNVGKALGIFLDGIPISAPTVQQAISGGEAVISGDFSVDEAKNLSIAINSGALPVPIKLKELKAIGPTLGAEHVRKSVFAGMIGLVAVVVFMVSYYGFFGIIASFALLIYGLITFALFRAIPVVLTLSGVAGFILSIGMAVDANILIFERIKEEERKVKSRDIAIRIGFGKAISAIKDANLTTLLVAFILFNPFNFSLFPQFGLVKGFALTLGIGVLTSLFTGVVITRRLIGAFYKNQPRSKPPNRRSNRGKK